MKGIVADGYKSLEPVTSSSVTLGLLHLRHRRHDKWRDDEQMLRKSLLAALITAAQAASLTSLKTTDADLLKEAFFGGELGLGPRLCLFVAVCRLRDRETSRRFSPLRCRSAKVLSTWGVFCSLDPRLINICRGIKGIINFSILE